jgi:hypothetical protein
MSNGPAEQQSQRKRPSPVPPYYRFIRTEHGVAFLKEVVTAVLGLAIVGFTLYMAAAAFSFVGNSQSMSDARVLLTLMLGLSGVVLGYYFGRVPADMRAAQAQEQTNDAMNTVEHFRSRDHEMGRKLHEMGMDAMKDAMAGKVASPEMAQKLIEMGDRCITI